MIWVLLAIAIVIGVLLWIFMGESNQPMVVNPLEAHSLRPPLADFIAWWNVRGPFRVRIATNAAPFDKVAAPGGFRTDAQQLKAFQLGLSKASTASQTAHGRGAALDLWPEEFDPRIPWENQSLKIKAKFATYGAIAIGKGFNWGGDWESFKDYPHIEIKGWRMLPIGPYAGV